jgi:small subunit ribosomal protein S3
LGVKVWINHGEILDKGLHGAMLEEKLEAGRPPRRDRDGDRRPRRDGDRPPPRRDGDRPPPRRDGDRPPRRDRDGRDQRGMVELPKAINPRMKRPSKAAPPPKDAAAPETAGVAEEVPVAAPNASE